MLFLSMGGRYFRTDQIFLQLIVCDFEKMCDLYTVKSDVVRIEYDVQIWHIFHAALI